MAGLMQSLFVPHGKPQASKAAQINIVPPTEAAGAAGVADVTKSRQGRGLASTNLSGMRSMVGQYQSGKSTLGAG